MTPGEIVQLIGIIIGIFIDLIKKIGLTILGLLLLLMILIGVVIGLLS